MFQKVVLKKERVKLLKEYRGKKVIVHAVRPDNDCNSFQRFKYTGFIDSNINASLSLSLGCLFLNINNMLQKCRFLLSTNARYDECFVISVEDAETHEIIYNNDVMLKFSGNEITGNGIISGVNEDDRLGQYNGKPGILLNTFESNGQKYMKLRVANKLTYIGEMPNGFKLINENDKTKDDEKELKL